MSKDNFTKDDQSQIDIGENITQYDSPSNARMYETINKVTNFTGVKPKEILFSTFDKTRKYDTEQIKETIGKLLCEYSDNQYVCIAITQDKDVHNYRRIYFRSDEPFGTIYGDMDYEFDRVEDSKHYSLYFDIANNELLQGDAGFGIKYIDPDGELGPSNAITYGLRTAACDSYDDRNIDFENEYGYDDCLVKESKNGKIYIPYEDTSIVIYTVDANTLPKSTKSWLKK